MGIYDVLAGYAILFILLSPFVIWLGSLTYSAIENFGFILLGVGAFIFALIGIRLYMSLRQRK